MCRTVGDIQEHPEAFLSPIGSPVAVRNVLPRFNGRSKLSPFDIVHDGIYRVIFNKEIIYLRNIQDDSGFSEHLPLGEAEPFSS